MQKTVLITGGTRGIGKAIAETFLKEEWHVIITGTAASRPDADWPTVVPEYLQACLDSDEGIDAFVQEVRALSRLDAVINNAGINIVSPLSDVLPEDYDVLQRVNLKAPYFITQAAAGVMKNSGGGAIVNIASIWSVITRAQRSMYSAAKAGLAGLTRAAAVELASDHVLVNAISPGFIDTELTRKSLSPEQLEALIVQVPLSRLGDGDDIASLAYYLCSEKNRFITGQNIVVDGGFTLV